MTSTTTAILRRQQIVTQFTGGIAIAFLAIAAVFVAPTVLRAAPPLPGAVFTTDSNCQGVDLNIYGSKTMSTLMAARRIPAQLVYLLASTMFR
jgi:hypothetical protein